MSEGGGMVIDIDAYRPGWGVYRNVCNRCKHSAISVVHPNADLTKLECSGCGASDSTATSLEEP